jgi:hypothetical protein
MVYDKFNHRYSLLFLLFTCMHFLVAVNLRRWSACASNASEVVRDCLKSEKHLPNALQTVTSLLANSACDDVVKAQHALIGGEWSASPPGRALPPGGPPGTHYTGGWVGSRAGLDTEARGKILSPLPGIEPRSPGRPTRSQTLY